MKNRSRIVILSLFVLIQSMGLFGQNRHLSVGDKLFEDGAYADAIIHYEKALKKEDSPLAKERLGIALVKVGNYPAAKEILQPLADSVGLEQKYRLMYADLLHRMGDYAEAGRWYRRYQGSATNPDSVEYRVWAVDNYQSFMEDSLRLEVKWLEFNSDASEFGPAPFQRGIMFASNRPIPGFHNEVDLSNNGSYYTIFNSIIRSRETVDEPDYLTGDVSTRFHDGPGVFDQASQTLYFTRSNFIGGKLFWDRKGYNRLKIFASVLEKDKFKKAKELPFNSDDFSSGHPAISPDGSRMIFVSDRDGGLGSTDLWMSEGGGEEWSEPIHLGNVINSEGQEAFPYWVNDTLLYFASDGFPGLGGLDIFYTVFRNGEWTKPKNQGYPVNSSADDFGLMMWPRKDWGYFTSNRIWENADDIFYFMLKTVMEIRVVDEHTGEVLPETEVAVLDEQNAEQRASTDSTGFTGFSCEPEKLYQVTLVHQGYDTVRVNLSTRGILAGEVLDTTLKMHKNMSLMVFGTVIDELSGEPLPLAKVTLRFGDDEPITVMTDSAGYYELPLEADKDYFMVIEKDAYVSQVNKIKPDQLNNPKGVRFDAALKQGNDFMMVEGMVVIKHNGKPLPGVKLLAVDNRNRDEVKEIISDRDGKFFLALETHDIDDYSIIASEHGFFTARLDVVPEHLGGKKAIIEMEMVEYGLNKVLKTIFYDFNRSALKPLSVRDLNEIYYFLVENPEAVIELGSHTDSRGTRQYNASLSQRRSEAVVNYILEMRVVDAERIIAKGYGEDFLVNDCDDYKPCSEEDHQKNRRTEVKVVAIKALPAQLEKDNIVADELPE